MTIDGVNVLDYGLVPITVTGGYDMPGRITPFFYDWGDTIEPLLTASYAGWRRRNIFVDCVYDSRRQTIGVPSTWYLDGLIQGYKTGADIALILTDAVGAIGSFTVRLKAVTKHKKYRGTNNHRMTWEFEEVTTVFSGVVPVAKNGGSISIDGYGLSQFGATILKITNLSGLGALSKSPESRYLTDVKLSSYRDLHGFNLKMVIYDNDPIAKLASFQKVLTGEQVLPFVYNGLSFDTFCGQGFSVVFLSSKAVSFNLTLYRL